jgi:hypothetical protein
MREFFQQLLPKLHALTGIDQGAKLSREQVTELFDALVCECNEPEWAKIKPEVKERVILDSIKNEKEFYGLNVKFVRAALRKFWDLNGQRILEIETSRDFIPLKRTPEELKRIDEIANAYLAELKPEPFRMVPRLSRKEIEEEGQVRPKAAAYVPDVAYVNEHKRALHESRVKTVKERYPDICDEDVEEYIKQNFSAI